MLRKEYRILEAPWTPLGQILSLLPNVEDTDVCRLRVWNLNNRLVFLPCVECCICCETLTGVSKQDRTPAPLSLFGKLQLRADVSVAFASPFQPVRRNSIVPTYEEWWCSTCIRKTLRAQATTLSLRVDATVLTTFLFGDPMPSSSLSTRNIGWDMGCEALALPAGKRRFVCPLPRRGRKVPGNLCICAAEQLVDVTQKTVLCAACNRVSCITCARQIYSPERQEECRTCFTVHHYSNRFHRRLVASPATRSYPSVTVVLAPAADVTEAAADSQLGEIAQQQEGNTWVRCAECAVPLTKSTACNALAHCNHEHCYVCGYMSDKYSTIPESHWDETGKVGCPRFDSDPAWRDKSFLAGKEQDKDKGKDRNKNDTGHCAEGICYSETQTCTLPHHATYRKRVADKKKTIMTRNFIDAFTGPAYQSLRMRLRTKWLKII